MRIFFKPLVCFFTVILIISSCKKDNGNYGALPNSQVLPTYNNVYGVLIAGKVVDYFSPAFSDTSYEAAAIFYNSPQTNIELTNANTTSVTAVSLNNAALYLYSPASTEFIYVDTVSNLKLNNLNWQVQGAGSIPSFVQAPTFSYPSYTGYTFLPDTINIGLEAVFKVNGITNADSLHLQISSSSNKKYSSPNVGASTSSYTVTSNSLVGLDTTSYGQLSVLLEKIVVQAVNGKNIVLIKSLQFNKNVVIINQ